MTIKSLTIYCSSSNNLTSDYYDLAEKIGKFLSRKSIQIIYGGGSVGLMGKVASSAYNTGGHVIGIIPTFLVSQEKISRETYKTIIVKNMSERKKKLFEMGDAFLILPGGSGTIEEATEVISWKFLGLHNKEIIIFNFKDFWNPLIKIYMKKNNKKFGNKNLQNKTNHINTLKEFKKLFP